MYIVVYTIFKHYVTTDIVILQTKKIFCQFFYVLYYPFSIVNKTPGSIEV